MYQDSQLRLYQSRSYLYQTCTSCVMGAIAQERHCSVSFFPCTNCGQRDRGKLAGVYAYWYASESEREAYRCRFCAQCLIDLMGSLKAGESADSSILTACPMCGTDSSANLSGIFLTVYPPKQPEREYALTMCASCAAQLQTIFAQGDRLADRGGAGAAAPAQSAASSWDSVPW